jgi:very-short-patch-repair endonuclease
MQAELKAQFSKSLMNFIEGLYEDNEERNRTESPIESMLYLALKVFPPLANGTTDGLYFTIKPQAIIGEYRVDFLVQASPDRGIKPRYSSQVIVECDGHEFHEKNKEQVDEDNTRDRALQALGYNVLHFNGSAIWKNALGCASEVALFLVRDLDKKGNVYAKTLTEESVLWGTN